MLDVLFCGRDTYFVFHHMHYLHVPLYLSRISSFIIACALLLSGSVSTLKIIFSTAFREAESSCPSSGSGSSFVILWFLRPPLLVRVRPSTGISLPARAVLHSVSEARRSSLGLASLSVSVPSQYYKQQYATQTAFGVRGARSWWTTGAYMFVQFSHLLYALRGHLECT